MGGLRRTYDIISDKYRDAPWRLEHLADRQALINQFFITQTLKIHPRSEEARTF
jgi:hypothetical protein